MTAPRIDGVRNEVRRAQKALDGLLANIEDLHVLAYNRYEARQAAKVRGGQPDWCLDTHGDKDARDLYVQVTRDMRTLLSNGTKLADEVRTFMEERGGGTSRRDQSADASSAEVTDALAAQRRRRGRGEYTPTHQVIQPLPAVNGIDWRTECEALRSAFTKATGAFVADHQCCTVDQFDAREHAGWRKRKLLRRLPLNRLTPRERDAVRRAQSVRTDSSEKAS